MIFNTQFFQENVFSAIQNPIQAYNKRKFAKGMSQKEA